MFTIVCYSLGHEDKGKLKVRSTGIFDKKQPGSSSLKAWNVLKRLDSSVLRLGHMILVVVVRYAMIQEAELK